MGVTRRSYLHLGIFEGVSVVVDVAVVVVDVVVDVVVVVDDVVVVVVDVVVIISGRGPARCGAVKIPIHQSPITLNINKMKSIIAWGVDNCTFLHIS